MNYLDKTPFFKMRKAFRYLRLYGFSQTLVKIKSQYHGNSQTSFTGPRWDNEDCKNPEAQDRSVAIIGCGNHAYSVIAYYLDKKSKNFLRATFDVDKNKSASLCKAYGGVYATADWKDILRDKQVKTVFIASNHASHAEYAIEFIKADKHVHIEKPHVVTYEQLDMLADAMQLHPASKIFLGFNRPRSDLFLKLQKYLSEQTGPLMINWFIAGHDIPEDHWYYDAREGGRVLGNLCHWTDLTLHLVGLSNAFPCRIIPGSPKEAKSDFVLNFIFADKSCASITFSAKGPTFEGVREILNIHKGDLLGTLSDFQSLRCDIVERKLRFSSWHRDHGHSANIYNTKSQADSNLGTGERLSYVSATAHLFLASRNALENGVEVIVTRDEVRGLDQ